MSLTGNLERISETLLGIAGQLVNSITESLTLPIPNVSHAPVGDVVELGSTDAMSGANFIEKIIDLVTGKPRFNGVDARRGAELIGAVQVLGSSGIERLSFTAQGENLNWGVLGKEARRIGVYVDGKYQSSMIVMSEKTGRYSVDIDVGEGAHSVELVALDSQGVIKVQDIRQEKLSGLDELIARHAPIVEMRSDKPQTGQSDAPLEMIPIVTNNSDGTKTIEYRVVFSNEDGGTKIDDLLKKYGRATDIEPIYKVKIAADGSIIESYYHAPLHEWLPFVGQREQDRPILRVSTTNNLVSTRVHKLGEKAERWGSSTTSSVDGSTSDFDIMQRIPWSWTIMAKELVREGKLDPSQYIFLAPLNDAQKGAIESSGGINLTLKDGKKIKVSIDTSVLNTALSQTAVKLPSNILVDAIQGIDLLGARGIVLDSSSLNPRLIRDLNAA